MTLNRNFQPHAGGIACPVCRERDTDVKDSRPAFDGLAIRRRRTCAFCNHRFTTHETVKRDVPVLVFPNGVAFEIDLKSLEESLFKDAAATMAKNFTDRLFTIMREEKIKPR